MQTEKKSERLEVRLGYTEKQQFTDACDSQGDTPSGAMRRFIRGYVRRANRDEIGSVWRSSAVGQTLRRLKSGARVALVAVAVVSVSAFSVWVAMENREGFGDDEIFISLDVDGDGVLSLAEQRGSSDQPSDINAVMRVLDLDSSGTLSRTEFVSRGKMIFVLENIGNDYNAPAFTSEGKATYVDFIYEKNGLRASTFGDAVVNADGMDRMVIWHSDGQTILSGRVAFIQSDVNTMMADSVITRPSVHKIGQ